MKTIPKIKDMTQLVKSFLGSQLQRFRTFKDPSAQGFFLHVDFYPGPRNLILARSAKNLVWVEGFDRKLLKNQTHPIELYMRAHFEGARLLGVENNAQLIHWDFASRGSFCLDFSKGDFAQVSCLVPGRKEYTSQILLAVFKELQELGVFSEEPLQSRVSSVEKKWRRLLAKVEGDVTSAREWLDKGGSLCHTLESDPQAWLNAEAWSPNQLAWLEEQRAQGVLPNFGAAHLGRAQEMLFSLRRRYQRKWKQSQERLKDLLNQGDKNYYSQRGSVPSVAPSSDVHLKDERPVKKPGLWVRVDHRIWVRVGRSSAENEALFKQAKDRDLWFHVRGYAGAHVWVPRGQPEFSKKGDLSETLLVLICQLALFNSKLRESGRGTVDYTERRHLKKIPGKILGQVSILRSQTRSIQLDPEFESRWLSK